jgi:tellurite resistance protein
MHEQNMAIVKSLVSVAWADGNFADEEREMVEALIAAFDATEDEAKEIRTFAAEKKTIEDVPVTDLSTDDRRVLLQHAVLLAYVDGEQHAAEKSYIETLCKKLRIPDDEAKSLIGAAEDRAKRFLNLL